MQSRVKNKQDNRQIRKQSLELQQENAWRPLDYRAESHIIYEIALLDFKMSNC